MSKKLASIKVRLTDGSVDAWHNADGWDVDRERLRIVKMGRGELATYAAGQWVMVCYELPVTTSCDSKGE